MVKKDTRKVVLIACCSSKLGYATTAEKLYVSDLFKKSLAYAKTLLADKIYILSAKYGLVSLDELISPYDITLNDMNKKDREKWYKSVISKLKRNKEDIERTNFVFLAGDNYRKGIIPSLGSYEIPMKGLGIGQQLSFLKKEYTLAHGKENDESLITDESLVEWLMSFYSMNNRRAKKALKEEGRRGWLMVRSRARGITPSPLVLGMPKNAKTS